ncbi:putative RNA-directed DNA polymerase from transposon BS [Trichonephila clavipes]|nr:putative RNA-directed DNA polymerase from transposon BS [Trichonephila clavipes]
MAQLSPTKVICAKGVGSPRSEPKNLLYTSVVAQILVFLADFSMHELLLVLNVLDPKKSPGPDNIRRVLITHLGPSCTQRLLDIFNQSWKSGRLPHEWKRASIIPIRKPGKYNKALSKDFKLTQGVPEGSVLSPTLFSMFLAGVEKLITENSSIGLFADDIVLWHSSHNIPSIEANHSQCLSRVNDFATNHKLSFTLMRSVTSFFTTNRHLYKYQPTVFIKDQKLLYVKHPKYLGFTLAQKILCNWHTEDLNNKRRKCLNTRCP